MGNINNSLTTFTNYNVAVGYEALRGSTNAAANTGNNNTAVGYQTLLNNTSGHENTAIGVFSLNTNTTGIANTAVGQNALYANTIGKWNSAFGCQALVKNIDGNSNTAFGLQSLWGNTSGNNNTAIGRDAMVYSTTGNNNVAVGQDAGYNLGAGSNNVLVGYQAGYNETGSNKLYISNSNTSTPLIYGDFSTSTLTVYNNLNINNKYTFPSVDGTSGQVLISNGAGIVGWNSLATVATSGSYSDLSNKPANVSAFANDAGYLTSFTEMDTTVWKNNSSNIYYNLGNVGIGLVTPLSKISVEAGSGIPGMTIKKTAGSEDLLQFITASGTKHLSIDYTGQLTYNVGATGPIYFGNFNNATDGRAGFSTPMNVIMGIDASTHRFGIGGGGTYFVGNAPNALLEVRGKADELQLAIQANTSQTANLTEWRNSNGTAISVVNSNGNFGIGMNNPSYALSVKHTNYGTGFTVHLGMETNDCIMLQNTNVESTISSTNERFHLANNTTNIITMYNSNVGFGTISPTTKLDVVGGLKVSGTSSDKNISLTGGFGSGIGGEITLMSGYGTNTRGGNINIAAGYTSSWAGIGTSSDIFIKGGCMETITSYASVQVGGGKSEVGGTNETAGGDLSLSGGNANLGNQNGGNIILLPGTASGSGVNGNVGIGTATPARTLHINAVMRLEPIPTAPSSPSKGDIYFDSTINKLRVYDGTIWQDCW